MLQSICGAAIRSQTKHRFLAKPSFVLSDDLGHRLFDTVINRMNDLQDEARFSFDQSTRTTPLSISTPCGKPLREPWRYHVGEKGRPERIRHQQTIPGVPAKVESFDHDGRVASTLRRWCTGGNDQQKSEGSHRGSQGVWGKFTRSIRRPPAIPHSSRTSRLGCSTSCCRCRSILRTNSRDHRRRSIRSQTSGG